MKKNKFILPVIAIALMLGSFIFIYFDLRSEGNTYVEDTKISKEAKKEAEAAVLFSDLKRALSISFITTTTKDFTWLTEGTASVVIKGWGISSNVSTALFPKVSEYLTSSNFEFNDKNTNISTNTIGYERDTLVCLVNSKAGSSADITVLDINCGYLVN